MRREPRDYLQRTQLEDLLRELDGQLGYSQAEKGTLPVEIPAEVTDAVDRFMAGMGIQEHGDPREVKRKVGDWWNNLRGVVQKPLPKEGPVHLEYLGTFGPADNSLQGPERPMRQTDPPERLEGTSPEESKKGKLDDPTE